MLMHFRYVINFCLQTGVCMWLWLLLLFLYAEVVDTWWFYYSLFIANVVAVTVVTAIDFACSHAANTLQTSNILMQEWYVMQL